MSDCIDKKLGQLLHDYELGLLSDEDSSRFEMHLYECDYCLEQVREFMDVSRFIAANQDSRAIIEEAAGQPEHGNEKKSSAPIIKLLIAAAIALVIFIPIYKFVLYEKPVSITQTLELLPTRTGGNDVIYLDKGGDVQISFYVADNFKGPADLIIAKVNADTVISQKSLTDFDEHGVGTIIVPVTKFSAGHYTLHLIPVENVDWHDEKLYMFRVK
jgi:hypothetical protein